MIRRYLIAALAVACVVLGGLAWFWQGRAAANAEALSVARSQLAQHAEAAKRHEAYIAWLERKRADEVAEDLQLKSLEGRDETAPDALLRAGRILWP
ncbi:MAG: hypothetical protein V7668_14610 [Cereibacter changlensis]